MSDGFKSFMINFFKEHKKYNKMKEEDIDLLLTKMTADSIYSFLKCMGYEIEFAYTKHIKNEYLPKAFVNESSVSCW